MGWLRRLFDERGSLVRIVVLDFNGLGYLLLIAPAFARPGPVQWLLAVLAFAAALLLHRRPVASFAVQAALLVAALTVIDDSTINTVGASWALLEVTIRASTAARWCGSLTLGVIHLAAGIGEPVAALPGRLYGLAAIVGVPLLLARIIRTNAELDRRAAERVAEEQLRRESEARADRADERSAIARELHDAVAHHVASMVLRVGVARDVLPDLEPSVRGVFDDVHDAGTTALADLRRLVAVLRDPDGVRGDPSLTVIEPSALPAALDGAVESARRAGLVVDAEVSDAVGTLDAVRGLALLRLTQEALTNVTRHAGTAARVRLRVAVADGDVSWEVSDDGGGPAPAEPVVAPGGGHGLTGMRERVSVLGGVLEAGPEGAGWTVRTTLPRVAT